jgi:maleylacetate reductase
MSARFGGHHGNEGIHPVTEFCYTGFAQRVIFGPGSIARLGEAVDRFAWQRMMLCTNRSQRANSQAVAVESTLGRRLVASYEWVQPHVRDSQIAEALALAIEKEVEAVIALGGGSPIGMAKAVSAALEEQRTGRPTRTASPTDQPLVPVAAIPTTYAGSEMTPIYGITHHTDGATRKITLNDPKVAPRLVIYDPQLTLDLPPAMTASTGINALAHCVEALYSITRHPLSAAAALGGVRHINHALVRCYSNGADLEARTEMMIGAHLAGFALSSVAMGLHHGLCHVLGGTVGVPHGVANSIVLPHAMRFNRAAGGWGLPAAEAMGIATDGLSAEAAAEAAAKKVSDLVIQMNLPQRLRDAGVKEADLPRLAQLAYQSGTVRNNPEAVDDPTQIETMLRVMW